MLKGLLSLRSCSLSLLLNIPKATGAEIALSGEVIQKKSLKFQILYIQKDILCLVTQLCLTLCDPTDCSPPSSSVHGDSPGKNTGVVCHVLLQGIFPIQGLNPGLPHCWQILYCLSHQESPQDIPLGFSQMD